MYVVPLGLPLVPAGAVLVGSLPRSDLAPVDGGRASAVHGDSEVFYAWLFVLRSTLLGLPRCSMPLDQGRGFPPMGTKQLPIPSHLL